MFISNCLAILIWVITTKPLGGREANRLYLLYGNLTKLQYGDLVTLLLVQVESCVMILILTCHTFRLMVCDKGFYTGVLLNTAKNTREQIYLKIQGFQQQRTSKNTREQIYLKIQGFQQQGTNLLDIN